MGFSCFRHENASRYSGLCTVTLCYPLISCKKLIRGFFVTSCFLLFFFIFVSVIISLYGIAQKGGRHITYLLDVFTEFGVDVIQMDQQMNMGLELLGKWTGKICFLCPVDIQHSVQMTKEEMGSYIKDMIHALSTEKGGFMYKAYPQPAAIHMPEEQLRQEIELMKNG